MYSTYSVKHFGIYDCSSKVLDVKKDMSWIFKLLSSLRYVIFQYDNKEFKSLTVVKKRE